MTRMSTLTNTHENIFRFVLKEAIQISRSKEKLLLLLYADGLMLICKNGESIKQIMTRLVRLHFKHFDSIKFNIKTFIQTLIAKVIFQHYILNIMEFDLIPKFQKKEKIWNLLLLQLRVPNAMISKTYPNFIMIIFEQKISNLLSLFLNKTLELGQNWRQMKKNEIKNSSKFDVI